MPEADFRINILNMREILLFQSHVLLYVLRHKIETFQVPHAAFGSEVELLRLPEVSHLRNQSPEVDPAVGYCRHPEINQQHKIPVFFLGRQVHPPFLEKTV